MDIKDYFDDLFANTSADDFDETMGFVLYDLAELFDTDPDGFILWAIEEGVSVNSIVNKSIFDYALFAGLAEMESRNF